MIASVMSQDFPISIVVFLGIMACVAIVAACK